VLVDELELVFVIDTTPEDDKPDKVPNDVIEV
jgi:hypothetical protein